MNGDVSNTGRCAIHDAGWSSFEGAVLVLETDGEIVYRRDFSANILSVSISPSGRYVLAQTLHAPESPDSERIEVLDLDTGDIPIKTSRKTANPSCYIIEETAGGALNRVTALVPQLGEFSYSAEGVFVDEYSYKLAQIDGENVYESVLAMGELLKRNDHAVAKKMIESAPKVIGRLLQINPRWAAKALRYLGESFELQNRSADAVAAYRQALSIDSTVGVKKRIERIESA